MKQIILVSFILFSTFMFSQDSLEVEEPAINSKLNFGKCFKPEFDVRV